jgi:hypothetical protein
MRMIYLVDHDHGPSCPFTRGGLGASCVGAAAALVGMPEYGMLLTGSPEVDGA